MIIIGLVSLLFQKPAQFYYCVYELDWILCPGFCYHPHILILAFFAIVSAIVHLYKHACAQKSWWVNNLERKMAD